MERPTGTLLYYFLLKKVTHCVFSCIKGTVRIIIFSDAKSHKAVTGMFCLDKLQIITFLYDILITTWYYFLYEKVMICNFFVQKLTDS